MRVNLSTFVRLTGTVLSRLVKADREPWPFFHASLVLNQAVDGVICDKSYFLKLLNISDLSEMQATSDGYSVRCIPPFKTSLQQNQAEGSGL